MIDIIINENSSKEDAIYNSYDFLFCRNLPDHRRSVAASLVQAVYILERDRQEKRQAHEALAPAWSEFCHFKPVSQLVDDVDSSIFGAIFEFNPPASPANSTFLNAPRFIVAFRGTIPKKESVHRDLRLDLHIVQNRLHKSSRCRMAIKAVQNLILEAETLDIWLAGHSLGSAIARITGKNMAKSGIFLDTFLFNPPFVAAPIDRIKHEKTMSRLRMSRSLMKVGFSVVLKGKKVVPIVEDSLTMLSSWVPCLFVNPGDHICSGYIGYFESLRKMEEMGAANTQRPAAQNSIRGLFLSAMGKRCDPNHVLPSASLTVNESPDQGSFMKAHALCQWWQLDLQLRTAQHISR